jgi:hypothetical protein
VSSRERSNAGHLRPFAPSVEAIVEVHNLEHGMLQMPDFTGFADLAHRDDQKILDADGAIIPLGVDHIADAKLRLIYFDAVLELHRLLEEYRFHIGLAHLLVLDIAPKVEAGMAETRKPKTGEELMVGPLPDELRVMLLSLFRPPPSATELFADPHALFTSGRRFSAWIAGQMLDNAFIRGVAAMDRIAALAWARAGRPLPRRRRGEGSEYLPEFSKHRLRQIDDMFTGQDGWAELLELSEHKIYLEVRRIRDGFTHARRLASELHGEGEIASMAGPTEEGVDAGLHLALGVGFYQLVLLPAVTAARRLMAIPGTER